MSTEPCIECGKPVSITRDHWRIEVVEQYMENGLLCEESIGWHAIGSECRKAYPKAEIFPGDRA